MSETQTCVVGLQAEDETYLACDSALSVGGEVNTTPRSKIFELDDGVLAGGTGRVRGHNLLNHQFDCDLDADQPIDELAITQFVPAYKELLDEHDFLEKEKEVASSRYKVLLATEQGLAYVTSDLAVCRIDREFHAVGCGRRHAHGALHATRYSDMGPLERIRKSLQAASEFSGYVGPPFKFISTENSKIQTL